jgi:hypothetical protein
MGLKRAARGVPPPPARGEERGGEERGGEAGAESPPHKCEERDAAEGRESRYDPAPEGAAEKREGASDRYVDASEGAWDMREEPRGEKCFAAA